MLRRSGSDVFVVCCSGGLVPVPTSLSRVTFPVYGGDGLVLCILGILLMLYITIVNGVNGGDR